VVFYHIDDKDYNYSFIDFLLQNIITIKVCSRYELYHTYVRFTICCSILKFAIELFTALSIFTYYSL